MNKIKLSICLGYPNPFPGAAWTRIGFFAENWSKKGFDIDVLGTFTPRTLHQRGSKLFGCKTSIFNIIYTVYLGSHPFSFVINSLSAFLASTIFFIVKRPGVVLVSVPAGDVGLGVIMACKIARIRYIVDYRDEWEDYVSSKFRSGNQKSFYRLVKKLMTYLYLQSCLTVTVTSSFLSELKSRGVVNAVLMPNGADISVFRPHNRAEIRRKLNLGESDFVIVYVGIIGEYYKLDIMIKILANIRRSNDSFKFIIVGEGSDLLICKNYLTSWVFAAAFST